MAAWIVWAARGAACFFFGGIGLVLGISSLASGSPGWGALIFSMMFIASAALAWPRRPNAWRSDPPTDRQIAFAQDLGIQIPPGISKGDLSDLISQAKAIRDQL